MSLDLDPIRKRLAATAEHDLSAKPAVRGFGDGDAYSECGGEALVWSADAGTIPPLAVFVSNAPTDIAALLSEVEALHSEIAALVEENIFFDVNLKDCVNFMRDLWPVVGVDLNALRLEPDRAAAIETVQRAVEDWGTDD